MARTVSEIKAQMTAWYISDATIVSLYGLDREQFAGKTFEQIFSKVSLESILFGIVAMCAWLIESMIDTHSADVDAKIAAQKAHTPSWYQQKVLAFQEVYLPVVDTDYYDNSLLTDDQIAASKIIKYVSVAETETYSLSIKIRSEDGTLFSNAQIAAIREYIKEIKDVGVYFDLINDVADSMRLVIDVYYDAQILRADGSLLTAPTKFPVKDAIKSYLKSLRFDGYYTNQDLNDTIQALAGVSLCQIKSAESKYGTYPYQVIDARVKPYSGWFAIYNDETDLMITYKPK